MEKILIIAEVIRRLVTDTLEKTRLKVMDTLSLDRPGHYLHNSIIFYPISTFFILNCLFLRDKSNGVSEGRRYPNMM